MKIPCLTTLTVVAGLWLAATSCQSARDNAAAVTPGDSTGAVTEIINQPDTTITMSPDFDRRTVTPTTFVPTAIIYRTNGDYNNLVPVLLNESRTEIVSYPAPSDLTANSTPVSLVDGWLLDRRGISINTAFTDYTYDQYRALDRAPSTSELMEHILPEARVTAIRRLPMRVGEAVKDTAAIIKGLRFNPNLYPLIYEAPEVKS